MKVFKRRAHRVWYKDGLRFECQKCGRCCGGDPGVVWVKPEEAERIAQRLDMSPDDFYAGYTRQVGGRTSLTERANGDCVLLKDGRCRVYELRPVQCKTFPFWPWHLDAPEDWEGVARECPGVNKGRLCTCEEIQARASEQL